MNATTHSKLLLIKIFLLLRLENGNITKPVFLDESLPENNDQHQDLLLLKQLKEITLAAMEVRDQTRNIILQMNLIRPSLNGEL